MKKKKPLTLVLIAVAVIAVLAFAGYQILKYVVAAKSPVVDDPAIHAVAGTGAPGDWLGTLNIMGKSTLRVAVHIEKNAEGKLHGTLTSIDQSLTPVPLSSCSENEKGLEFSAERIGGSFAGEFEADGSRLLGKWKQGGVAIPLLLKRLEKPWEPLRPQNPARPYPYAEREVTFASGAGGGDVTLAGTLTTPQGTGPFPAVILITGSGAQDRDEAIMGHKPFLVLADYLTRRGIAVLRYDDRGVGGSTGVFAKATHYDFAADAAGAMEFLKKQPEIDPKRIGLCGHSEGATEAFMVAAARNDAAFVVSLAGVGVKMADMLSRQRTDLVAVTPGLKMSDEQHAQNRRVFEIARDKGDTPEARTEVGEILRKLGFKGNAADVQAAQIFSPWMIGLLRYDPAPTLAQVHCPVLALNGTKDKQVAADMNLTAIRIGVASGGNIDVTTVEMPDLNHLFQKCETGSPMEYSRIEETFNPAALEKITDWVLQKTRAH